MHIAIDIREACKPRRTGKGQWAFGFFHELQKRRLPLVAYTDCSPPFPLEEHVTLRHLPVMGVRWHRAVTRSLLRDAALATYISPTSYIVPWLLRGRVPTVPVVHDLVAFLPSIRHDWHASWIERVTLRQVLFSASHVLTVSQSTKQDVLARYPQFASHRVTPVFAGPLRPVPVASQPDGRTILCVATLCPRKNQQRLIQAFVRLDPSLRARTQLLLVGARGWHDQEIVSLAQSTEGVEWRSYVPDAVYEDLLHTCTVFALPSLYEGFGMQVLDALQRGIPVLTSQRGSLREVCGNAAHYVDPESVESIASGLDLLLRSDRVRADMADRAVAQSQQFSWARTVDLALSSLRLQS